MKPKKVFRPVRKHNLNLSGKGPGRPASISRNYRKKLTLEPVFANLLCDTLEKEINAGFKLSGISLGDRAGAHLNRVIGTRKDVLQELRRKSFENLEALNAYLNPLGFGLEIKPDGGKNQVEITYLPEIVKKFPELEQFRCAPEKSEVARELYEKYPSEVEQILMYEATKNPAPSLKVLTCAAMFYTELEAENRTPMDNTITVLEAIAKEPNTAEVELSIADTRVIEIYTFQLALRYESRGNYIRSRTYLENLFNVTKRFRFLLLLYLQNNLYTDRFTNLSNRLKSVKEKITPPFSSNYATALSVAHSIACLASLPERTDLEKLAAGLNEQKAAYTTMLEGLDKRGFEDPGFLTVLTIVNKYAHAWINLKLDRIEEARQIITEQVITEQEEEEKDSPFLYHAIEALIFQREGQKEKALAAAEEANKHRSNHKLYGKCQALITELDSIISAARKAEKSQPSPARPREKQKKEQALPAPQITIDTLIFSDGLERYISVFPKARVETINARLKKAGIYLTGCLKGLNAEINKRFTNETAFPIENESETIRTAFKSLGIAKISIIYEDGIKVRIYPEIEIPGTEYFEGELDKNFDLHINSNKDLRLVRLLLETFILQKIVEKIYGTIEKNRSLEWVLEEQPSEKTTAPIPLARSIKEPPKLKADRTPPPPPTPEEIFFKTNRNLHSKLRTAVARSGIDVMSNQVNNQILSQIIDLIEIIEKERDQGEAVDCFKVVPSAPDPLAGFINLMRIYGPRNGKEKLKELGLAEKTIDAYGFGTKEPSVHLSVVEFETGEGIITAVINRDGELIVPGIKTNGEFHDALHRTALAGLSMAVVPELGEVFRISTLPSPLQPEEIARRKTLEETPAENGKVKPRFKILPALVILKQDRSLGGVSKVLQFFSEQIREREIAAHGIISQPLFTKEGRVYKPFPEDKEARLELLTNPPASGIFLQTKRGHSYRLPLGLINISEGEKRLLPFQISSEMEMAAQLRKAKVVLTPRAYLYGVLLYGENEYLVHPKASVTPEYELPPVAKEEPRFQPTRSFGGYVLAVHHTITDEIVEQLLATEEAQQALRFWQAGELPEFNFADPKRRRKFENQKPSGRLFLIMPTFRGYNQGRFIQIDPAKLV